MESFITTLANIIGWLNSYHAFEVLIILGAILILIDYYFATDLPCQFAYFAFAVAIAIASPCGPLMCLLVFFVAWFVLILLHIFIFRRFLANAPKK